MIPLLAWTLALLAAPAAAAPDVLPSASASLLGGQYFLGGKAASFDGRATAFLSPGLQFSEAQKLVPVYSGSYFGTQDIQELAGGDVLTTQRMSHNFSLAYVRADDFDKIKPRASFGLGYVRETKNEHWGAGLFDSRNLGAGLEGEHERYWGTITESYDYALVRYPNYSSLLSQSQGILDPQTFTELSQNSGSRVLDNENHRAALGLTTYWGPSVWKAGYDFTYRRYPDQSVVTDLGSFSQKRRYDLEQHFGLNVSRDWKPLRLGLGGSFAWLASNQNSYDASRTRYIDRYYDYLQVSLGPSARFVLKNGGGLAFETGWTQRWYRGRLAQDVDGVYQGSKVRQATWLTSLSARYPIFSRNIFARLELSYHAASSNMMYEADYRYNYQADTYLFGLDWEL